MSEETKQGEAMPGEAKVEEMKEEKKDEVKKEEEKVEEKKEEEAAPPPPVILSVDLHCLGCAKKIERCLLKCKGVEEVEIDMGQNQLKIRGVVDPQALCSRIKKKTLRSVIVISPVLPPPDEADSAKPQVVASQVNEVIAVELHVNMHCEACAQQLRKIILKLKGVQAAETDLSSGKVTVTGTMTGDKIVNYIYRRIGKLAKIIPPPSPPPPAAEEEKTGTMTGDKIVNYIYRRIGKLAKIIPPPPPAAEEEKKPEDPKPEEEKKEEKPAEEKKEENAEKKEEEKSPEMFKRMIYWNNGGGGHYNNNYIGEDDYNYFGKRMPVPWVAPGVPAVCVIERPPSPPQLFSDENPNACCIS